MSSRAVRSVLTFLCLCVTPLPCAIPPRDLAHPILFRQHAEIYTDPHQNLPFGTGPDRSKFSPRKVCEISPHAWFGSVTMPRPKGQQTARAARDNGEGCQGRGRARCSGEGAKGEERPREGPASLHKGCDAQVRARQDTKQKTRGPLATRPVTRPPRSRPSRPARR